MIIKSSTQYCMITTHGILKMEQLAKSGVKLAIQPLTHFKAHDFSISSWLANLSSHTDRWLKDWLTE